MPLAWALDVVSMTMDKNSPSSVNTFNDGNGFPPVFPSPSSGGDRGREFAGAEAPIGEDSIPYRDFLDALDKKLVEKVILIGYHVIGGIEE